MWVDHRHFGRPLTKLLDPEIEWSKEELGITVAPEGMPEIRCAKVHYFQTATEDFFAPGYAAQFKNTDNATTAQWKEVEMIATEDGRYTVTIPCPREKGSHIAFFATVDDFAGTTRGHVSSFMQWTNVPARDSK